MPTLSDLKFALARQEVNIIPKEIPIDMSLVASIILGGGEGTRLYPLTLTRCKPAISFGGKYRLVDVPISNSIHTGCHKIFLLTQFLSSSLHRHVFQTYHQAGIPTGFIEVLSAEHKPMTKQWYQGTADAVRQNIEHFLDTPADYFLILSGDQLYNLDFCNMMRFAKKTDADVVIAALPVNSDDAQRLGILKIDDDDFVVDFIEKPQGKKVLEQFLSPNHVLKRAGVESPANQYLGSMGIYLFKRQALIDLLEQDPREDFGKHLIPTQIKKGGIAAFLYDGYWEDIGTIGSFYHANMALTGNKPPFNLYSAKHPIYSCRHDVPPARIVDAIVNQSLICEGCIVEEGSKIKNSILGPRTKVKKGTIIHDSYTFGNDYYEPPLKGFKKLPESFHIGENCIIKKAIIDKHAQIGNGVQLTNKKNLIHYDSENIFIRDGIIIVPTGVTIPDGFIL